MLPLLGSLVTSLLSVCLDKATKHPAACLLVFFCDFIELLDFDWVKGYRDSFVARHIILHTKRVSPGKYLILTMMHHFMHTIINYCVFRSHASEELVKGGNKLCPTKAPKYL